MGTAWGRMPRPTAAFLAVFLGALLVVFGAAALPGMTHNSPQGLPQRHVNLEQPAAPSAPAEATQDAVAPQNQPDQETVGSIGQTIAAVLFAIAVLLLALLALSLRRRVRAPAEPESEPALDLASDAKLRAAVAATLSGAGASLAAATGSDLHSRLIASWSALEDLAASQGQVRRTAQTPTEHAGSMLAAFGVSSAPLARLLALYERARYDAGTQGWSPDPEVARRAGSDFELLARQVSAAGPVRRRRAGHVDDSVDA